MPHVLAGVESVMLLPCPGPEDGDEDVGGERMSGKTPALIAAVFSFVMVRLTGQQTDTKQYNEQVRRVLSVLRELREDEAALARIGEGEEAWKGWEEVRKKDVDDWLKEISNHGWLRMAWWENIIDGSGASGEVEIESPESEEEREDADEEEESKRLREVRAGSMRQEEFDYLSETKREQFARWKKLMLVKIDELVQSGILEEEGEDTEMRDVS
jgi:origin recognition complex subunit 6